MTTPLDTCGNVRVLNGAQVRELMANRAKQASLVEDAIRSHIRAIFEVSGAEADQLTLRNVRQQLASSFDAHIIHANKKMIKDYSSNYAKFFAESYYI